MRLSLYARTAPSWLAAALLASCAQSDPSAETLVLLQDLNEEVFRAIESVKGGTESIDGTARWRLDGQLNFVDLRKTGGEDELDPQPAWIVDAWGNPVVFVQDPTDKSQWCLLSAGADGLWTTDAALADAAALHPDYVRDRTKFCARARAPEYRRGRGGAPFWVCGDDIVVQASGDVAQPYPHPLSGPRTVAEALIATLRGDEPSSVLVAPELREDIEELSAEDRSLLASEVERHEAKGYLSEDDWRSHPGRKDGFVPRLYLVRQGDASSGSFVWIDPSVDGWAVDADCVEILRAAEPARESKQDLETVPTHEVLGQKIEAEGLFVCLEAASGRRNDAAWKESADEVRGLLSALSDCESCDFFLVVCDEGAVEVFPAGGRPTRANSSMMFAARRFLTSMARREPSEPPTGSPDTGAARKSGLLKSLAAANLSSCREKAILYVYVGAVGGKRDDREMDDLNAILTGVTAQNYNRTLIFVTAIGVDAGSNRETFLKALAEANGGVYVAR